MVVRIIAVDGKKEYQLSHVRIPAIAETTIKNTSHTGLLAHFLSLLINTIDLERPIKLSAAPEKASSPFVKPKNM
jgi:hypothetical protein